MYLCGPTALRDAVRRAWLDSGRGIERLRFETFASGGRFAPEEFVVRVADRDDLAVTVPGNRTMLDALEEAGVELIWDCRRGECGLCSVTVLAHEGELDHRDVFLSETEQAEGCSLARVCVACGGWKRDN